MNEWVFQKWPIGRLSLVLYMYTLRSNNPDFQEIQCSKKKFLPLVGTTIDVFTVQHAFTRSKVSRPGLSMYWSRWFLQETPLSWHATILLGARTEKIQRMWCKFCRYLPMSKSKHYWCHCMPRESILHLFCCTLETAPHFIALHAIPAPHYFTRSLHCYIWKHKWVHFLC